MVNIVDQQRECMEAWTGFLDALLRFNEDPDSNPCPEAKTFFDGIQTEVLETFLYQTKDRAASMSESAALEVVTLILAILRDLRVRRTSRLEYFQDHSHVLDLDLRYLEELIELQSQYLLGNTPYQRN